MDWKTLLAYITGTVDQELLVRNEYLVTENRILRNPIKGRLRLSDDERTTLAEFGQKLGKHALAEVAKIVKPDTILAWHRKLVAQKCDGSKQRKGLGRPKVDPELEALVVRMAQENRSWGYDRIVGALANLGYTLSDQTVGNILKRHGFPPAPERKTTTTWKAFIRTHMDVLVATDFFTAEVWTLGGLVTYYVLFFIRLGTREVHVAGMTPHPDAAWMRQVARHLTMEEWGFLSPGQYLIHDRDGKYCPAFQQMIDTARMTNGERVRRWFQDKKAGWYAVLADLQMPVTSTLLDQAQNAIDRKLFMMKGFHHPGGSQQAFLTGLTHLYNLVPYQRRAIHAGQGGVEVEGGTVPTRDWFLNLQILTSGGFR